MNNSASDYFSGPLQRQNIFHIMVNRFAVIDGMTLTFYKDETRQKLDMTFEITPDAIIDINDCKNSHKFTITAKDSSLTCCTEDTDKLMRWILAIRGCTFYSKKISMDDFNIISVIGRGYSGKVMLCESKKDGELLAIKSVQKWKLAESKKVQTILIERSILEHVNFPFIVSMKFAFQTEKNFYLGIEYVPGGELFNHMKNMRKLPLSEVKLYIAEIALALNYLHSHGIIYRDLKAENVLIGKDGHVKLTDFGLSKICESTSTFCGTIEYLSPEAVLHQNYGQQIDWWGLGVLTFELLFGYTPFFDPSRIRLFNNIVKNPPKFPNNTNPEVVEFINFVLVKDPKKRPGFHEIRRHSFFKEMDFEKVLKKEYSPVFIPTLQNNASIDNFDKEFTNENPDDSVADLSVGKDDQYLPGFSYEETHIMFDTDSERSFHSDDEEIVIDDRDDAKQNNHTNEETYPPSQ